MKKPNLIIYVHGWNSHAKARKAELLISELKDNNIDVINIISKRNKLEELFMELTKEEIK